MNIDEIMKEASQIENFQCRDGGASEKESADVEKELSITLPDEYRYFLSKYGYAAWFGDIIEGLDKEGTAFFRRRHVLKTTIKYREKYNRPDYQAVPEKGVVINTYGGGGYHFLFSKESKRAGQVGLFLTETFGQETKTYATFTDFLLYLVAKDAEHNPELEKLVKKPTLAPVDYSFLDDI